MNGRVLKIITKSFLAFMVNFLVLELFVHQFNPQHITPIHHESAFGIPRAWRANINYLGKYEAFDSNYFYKINIDKHHLRNYKKIEYFKPSRTFRIMGFGHSILAGAYVNNDETYSSYLDQILNQKVIDHHFDVINTGIAGWWLPEFFIYLKNEGYKFSPDLIILMKEAFTFHSLNTNKILFSEMSYERLPEKKVKIYLKGIRIELLTPNFWETYLNKAFKLPLINYVAQNSQLMELIRHRLASYLDFQTKNSQNQKNLTYEFIKSISLKENEQVIWIINDKEWQPFYTTKQFSEFLRSPEIQSKNKHFNEFGLILFHLALNHFIELVKKFNAKIVVVETPYTNEFFEINKNIPSYIPIDQDVFKLDLTQDFINFSKGNPTLLIYPDKAHLTPAGNYLAAVLTYNYLLRKKLFPHINQGSRPIRLLSSGTRDKVQQANANIRNGIEDGKYNIFLEGIKNKHQKKYDKAEELFLEIVQKFEKSINIQKRIIHQKALYQLGLIQLEKKDYQRAVEFFQVLPEDNIWPQKTYLNLARAYYRLRNFKSALFYLNKLESSQSGKADSEVYFWKSQIFLSLGQQKKAKELIDKAIAIKSNPKYNSLKNLLTMMTSWS